jgi:hypothetical protein
MINDMHDRENTKVENKNEYEYKKEKDDDLALKSPSSADYQLYIAPNEPPIPLKL